MAKRNIFLIEHMATVSNGEVVVGCYSDVWYGANERDVQKNMSCSAEWTAFRFTKVTPKDPLYPALVKWAQEPIWSNRGKATTATE